MDLAKPLSTNGKPSTAGCQQRLETVEGTGRRKSAAETDVCELELEHAVLKDTIEKTLKSEEQRDLVEYAIAEHELSERQACRAVNLNPAPIAIKPAKPMITKLNRNCSSCRKQPRWGCRKMTDYLRNQGHRWNHKRIRRIYRGLALNLPCGKPKKRLAARTALALGVPVQSDLTWSLDFMSDSLSNGRAIRTLNIIDDYNREALWIEVDHSLPAERVVRVLENLLLWRSCTQTNPHG